MHIHVVEILKNYDRKFLLRKRTNPHTNLSNETPYDHAYDLLLI
jgi:hypothetical protein